MAALAPETNGSRRYAELAVRVGANVQKGQTVFVTTQIEHAPLARAITRAAYGAGARYVDVELPRSARPQGDDRARPRRGAHAHAGVAEDAVPRDGRRSADLDDGRSRSRS